MDQPEPFTRGMVVVAHADDAEFGCSGTVAKWCKQGMEVVYVLCTDGSKGSADPEMTSRKLVEIRRQEQLEAGKVLGLKDVVFLGYEDAMLQPTLDVRRDIVKEIRRHKPDVLICQSPLRAMHRKNYIGHPDHLAAGEAAMSAVFPSARDRLTFPELLGQGLEPHKVRELMIMDAEEPDKWIDVSDTIEIAMDAVRAHKSQIREDTVERVMEHRRQAGIHHGMEYAESFKHFHLR